METLVDITTIGFEATLVVCLVFGLGYIYASKSPGETSSVLKKLSNNVLLPSLLFTTFASSTYLTWHRFLVMLWPMLVIALMTHLSSIAYALFSRRFFSSPKWIAQSVVYNNVGSYPLLIILALSLISPTDGARGMSHLKWRVMDELHSVTSRVQLYILVNLVVTSVCRTLIDPIVCRISPLGVEETDGAIALPDDSDTDERTPLVSSPSPKSILTSPSTYFAPRTIASVLGLLVAMVKPLQRGITGLTADHSDGTWFWQTFGQALMILGMVYAVVDILGTGVHLREAEHMDEKQEVPPTLGTILTLSLWRYVVIPLMVLYTIYGFGKISSTKAYLQDPAFSFALALTTFCPPTYLSHGTPFQSQVIFSTIFASLITCLPLAIAIAIPGRGVSYQVDFDLIRALKSAGGGGLAGAAAMVVQVLSLMPLRTIMNYQYRYGGSLKGVTKELWDDGGFKRYYAGLTAALFQGPFARFGDTAANAGIIALLSSLTWPVLIKTIAASVASACFRMVLTPIDTLKTTQQTKGGKAGLKLLKDRIKEKGVGCLWYGALATAAATFVGHYPWFGTYNYLSDVLPPPHNLIQTLLRQAFIGFAASVISDTVSNSLRVVKTYRQVHEGDVGYWKAANEIVASEGLLGLFGRGLPTRLLTNGLQGLLFSILWKIFADLIAGKGEGTGK